MAVGATVAATASLPRVRESHNKMFLQDLVNRQVLLLPPNEDAYLPETSY